jgi:hypothetical protein
MSTFTITLSYADACTIVAVSKLADEDWQSPTLACVHFYANDDGVLHVEATDGKVLGDAALASSDAHWPEGEPRSLLLPPAAIAAVKLATKGKAARNGAIRLQVIDGRTLTVIDHAGATSASIPLVQGAYFRTDVVWNAVAQQANAPIGLDMTRMARICEWLPTRCTWIRTSKHSLIGHPLAGDAGVAEYANRRALIMCIKLPA